MASTGEVACFGEDQQEAFLQSMLAATFKLPTNNRSIMLSFSSDDYRHEFAESLLALKKLGYKLFATPGTAEYYKKHLDLDLKVVNKSMDESDDGPGTALHEIKSGTIDLLINVSDGTVRKDVLTLLTLQKATLHLGP